VANISGRLLRRSARSKRRRRLAGRALRTMAFVVPRGDPPSQPVFVLGSPRSGTTLLFEVLRRSSAVSSLEGESHLLWEMFHPAGGAGWASHEIRAEDISDRERRILRWAVERIADGRRYLDKSPRNAVRVPYLDALFPDARFVFLKRDGRAAVSSLITGWRSEKDVFGGVEVPEPLQIEGYSGRLWRFVAPPGWRDYRRGHTLAEVCAFQWRATNEALLAARDAVPPERWVELTYERFVAAPREETARLLERLALPLEDPVLNHAASLDRHVTKVAVTPPRQDKWRDENPAEVERILPSIEPTMRRLGYRPDEAPSGSSPG